MEVESGHQAPDAIFRRVKVDSALEKIFDKTRERPGHRPKRSMTRTL